MPSPFGGTVLENMSGIFTPFSPDTPQSEIKIPHQYQHLSFGSGKKLTVPNTEVGMHTAFDGLVTKLNNVNPKGMTPYVVERDGNVIRIGRARSSDESGFLSPEEIARRNEELARNAEKNKGLIDRLGKSGILPKSSLIDEDGEIQ